MRLLIQNGYILSLDAEDRIFERGDIFIDGTKIIEIGSNLNAGALNPDRVIDATNKLVTPGMVNADLHADELLTNGLFENLPMELRPREKLARGDSGQSMSEMVFITALMAGIQALKTGVTLVQDHWHFSPTFTREGVKAVFAAYRMVGLRANLALEIDMGESLPAANDWPEQAIQVYEDILRNSQKVNGDRLRIAISPPQPSLANTRFVKWLAETSENTNSAVHFHFNRTKCQVISAKEAFQGLTAIEQAGKMGLLTPRTSVSHAVWVTPTEIESLAKSGVTVIHTPLSDLYTGSGVAPLHLMQEAGVHIGLGSGEGCGGNLTLFNVLKMTASIHRIVQPDYNRWVSVLQALSMAVHGGARVCLLDGQVGQIAAGCKADLVLYNLKDFAFSPLNNPKDQLVCLENGSSVDTVLVDGNLVVEGGKVITVDETDTLQQFRNQFQHRVGTLEDGKRQQEQPQPQPYLVDAYRKCVAEPMQIRRWADNALFDSRLKQAFTKKDK